MAKIDQEYHELCHKILIEGKEYDDRRRGVNRLQIPSYTFRHDMSDGFPVITNKKLYWKGVVTELLWFLSGSNDVMWLNQRGVKIWNKDAYNWYKRMNPTPPQITEKEFMAGVETGTISASVGQNYSVQWRNFNGNTDQIKNLIRDMMDDVMSSRLKVNAWNPSEVNLTALPPCHSEFQIIGVPLENNMFGFELHWTQRSVDTFLGLPFNIASYALLGMILQCITGYPCVAIEGNLKCVHFYDNQYDAAKLLVQRDPYKHENCKLEIDLDNNPHPTLEEIINYSPGRFKLIGYTSDDEIKVDLLAPKNC